MHSQKYYLSKMRISLISVVLYDFHSSSNFKNLYKFIAYLDINQQSFVSYCQGE